jgi:hypothetical protein
MNNFEINPCKACFEKFKNGNCSINNINNCCYTTLAAYKGNPSINSFRNSPEGQNCAQCLKNAIQMYGNSTCDLRLTASPVFDINNHYFPGLLAKYQDVEKAKSECIEMCKQNPNSYYTCVDNCMTDASAVQIKEKFTYSRPNFYSY